jgi:hypothetical protein
MSLKAQTKITLIDAEEIARKLDELRENTAAILANQNLPARFVAGDVPRNGSPVCVDCKHRVIDQCERPDRYTGRPPINAPQCFSERRNWMGCGRRGRYFEAK